MQNNRPRLFMGGPLILHDNARLHITDVVTKNFTIMGGKCYLMCSTPPHFDLFPKLKEPKRGQYFSSLEELSINVTLVYSNMNKSGVLDGIIMLPKH